MSNFLDLRCPSCGDEDHIDILAEIWLRATDNGTDPDEVRNRDWEYTPSSPPNVLLVDIVPNSATSGPATGRGVAA